MHKLHRLHVENIALKKEVTIFELRLSASKQMTASRSFLFTLSPSTGAVNARKQGDGCGR